MPCEWHRQSSPQANGQKGAATTLQVAAKMHAILLTGGWREAVLPCVMSRGAYGFYKAGSVSCSPDLPESGLPLATTRPRPSLLGGGGCGALMAQSSARLSLRLWCLRGAFFLAGGQWHDGGEGSPGPESRGSEPPYSLAQCFCRQSAFLLGTATSGALTAGIQGPFAELSR